MIDPARIAAGAVFGSVALILLGFALAMAYESFAIITGKDSTISALTAATIASHPHIALLAAFGAGTLLGALITHFTNWRP